MNGRTPVARLLASPGRRPLTADEEQLWSLVARTVRPLRLGKKPITEARRGTGVRHGAADPVGHRETHVAGSPQRAARVPTLSPIVRKDKQRLARGHMAVDARIDLHGMTQTQAYGALRRLLHRSQAKGAKFVLVITGKGVGDVAPAGGRGVLRRQVPMWLALPEFRRYVLGFEVADTGHGGEGALYVRVRKANA
jgi:DNA-nicking Smr family endonuclease